MQKTCSLCFQVFLNSHTHSAIDVDGSTSDREKFRCLSDCGGSSSSANRPLTEMIDDVTNEREARNERTKEYVSLLRRLVELIC